MKFVKAILSILVVAGLVLVLNRSWGPVPALGSFLSPFTGFWQNGENPVPDKKQIVLKVKKW